MDKTPILVVSCDRYSDIWEPFFKIFWKMWPDCPYPVYLGSNYKTYTDQRVSSITIGKDISWTSGVLRMLDYLNTEHVILFLEDLFIQYQVDTAAVDRLVRIAIERQIGCLYFIPSKFSTSIYGEPLQSATDFPDLYRLLPGVPYRVSTEVAIWQVETLRRFLIPGFSAWDFEYTGTKLSKDMPDIFWSSYNPVIIYDHGVEKGRWKPKGLAICREAGVEDDL